MRFLQTCVLITVILSCLSLPSTQARAWAPSSFPNPVLNPAACARGHQKSWICNPDHVLSAEATDNIEGILRDIAEARSPFAMDTCTGSADHPGFQVAVAVMRRMEVTHGDSAEQQAAAFARSLHAAWGVGDAQCENGVLLLLAIEDRAMYLSAGAGTLTRLDEPQRQYVLDQMRPLLRKGDINAAVERAVTEVGLVLAGASPDADEHHGSAWDWLFPGALLAMFGSLAGRSCWQGVAKRRESARCRSILERLKQEQGEALRDHRYPAASCPVCFEDLQQPGGNGGKAPADAPAAAPAAGAASSTDGSLTDVKAKLLDTDGQASEQESVVRRPLGLPCGHTFCVPCISRWLETHVTCPICRKPVASHEDPPANDAPLQSGQPGQALHRAAFNQEMYADEVQFRMNGLNRMYPHIITRDMASSWAAHTRSSRAIEFEAARDLQLHDVATRHRHIDQGGWGAVSSFGGGGGGGGGGTGGSW